ncbi:MAG: hypothetical protein M1816_002583 [Peltula sp. TS41687]|nr:MAG: hypothetical protein M1816_002583 [Peltula sp. TS41687]
MSHPTASPAAPSSSSQLSSSYPPSLQPHPHPPPPPPKPPSGLASSRTGTPSHMTNDGPPPPPPPPPSYPSDEAPPDPTAPTSTSADPGPTWLPPLLQQKSLPALSALLSSPALLSALSTSPSHAPPSHTHQTSAVLQAQLASNIALAQHLSSLADELSRTHAQTTAHLLRLHAAERAWRDKQARLDRALETFSPKALYQRLSAAVAEQEALCVAMEESFLDGPGGVVEGGDERDGRGDEKASDREVAEFVRRYRERREGWYLRSQEKERWDEGRVGGWR